MNLHLNVSLAFALRYYVTQKTTENGMFLNKLVCGKDTVEAFSYIQRKPNYRTKAILKNHLDNNDGARIK